VSHGRYTARVAIDWTDEEREKVENGIAKHGIRTGRCAALARIVHPVAQQNDPKACAIRLRPPKGATWLVPKASRIPYWKAHVYVETRGHAVDAVTGSDGYSPASAYVQDHWDFAELMRIEEVDPATVDPGIQDVEDES
jgi:hypothetical protein